ncbi:hypothetical protein P4O66_019738, partial [Electrophorus voltai]
MTSAFEALQQASIFTKLDLRSAYNLVRIREGDKWTMAFINSSGHYEYLVMPFGLMNALAIFQRYINEILREALDRYMFVYLDDILIYSQMVDKHVTHIKRVLQLLLENHRFVKMEKSVFHARTISFLEFVVSHNKLCMDPAKRPTRVFGLLSRWSDAATGQAIGMQGPPANLLLGTVGHSNLSLWPSLRVHPTFHVSRLRPMLCSVGPSDLPCLRMVNGAPAYTVNHLLDIRQVHGGVEYLVDWEGYRPKEQSWVPSRHILDCDLFWAFRQNHAAGLGMSGAASSRGGFSAFSLQTFMKASSDGRPPVAKIYEKIPSDIRGDTL